MSATPSPTPTPFRPRHGARLPVLGSPGMTGLATCLACRQTIYVCPLVDDPSSFVPLDPGAADRTYVRLRLDEFWPEGRPWFGPWVRLPVECRGHVCRRDREGGAS